MVEVWPRRVRFHQAKTPQTALPPANTEYSTTISTSWWARTADPIIVWVIESTMSRHGHRQPLEPQGDLSSVLS